MGREFDEFQVQGRHERKAISLVSPPAQSSLVQIAYSLRNFCEWWTGTASGGASLESRLANAVQSLLEAYARDMEEGNWSSDGAPLSNSTIRQRQIHALQFLRWAKAEGMAPKLALGVAYRTARPGTWTKGARAAVRRSYAVIRRPSPVAIRFPTTDQARAHVAGIADPACQLGAILVYSLGLRASEVISVPASAFTTGVVWSGNQPQILVKGKGQHVRSVEIPVTTLTTVQKFIQFERKIRLARVTASKRPATLLVRSDGSTLNYRAFWRAYRTRERLSPHLGRHWYAVNYLVTAQERIKADAAAHGRPLGDLGEELGVALMRLQQNLGHARPETTYDYLVYLSQISTPIDLGLAFQDLLDG